jgi:hypothetical protein
MGDTDIAHIEPLRPDLGRRSRAPRERQRPVHLLERLLSALEEKKIDEARRVFTQWTNADVALLRDPDVIRLSKALQESGFDSAIYFVHQLIQRHIDVHQHADYSTSVKPHEPTLSVTSTGAAGLHIVDVKA